MINIAIDGYSSCGKSTLAKALAKELDYTYIDTGAMYRAVTLFCIQNNLIIYGKVDEQSLSDQLNNIHITFSYNPITNMSETFLNGVNVEHDIRRMEVAENVSVVSTIKKVRDKLVQLQQELGKDKGVVMDGRDIGTVVFPDAALKIFLTASPEIRAQRRFDELKTRSEKVAFDEIKNNIIERDFLDTNRSESPLKKANDAVTIDNSNLTPEGQFKLAMELVKNIPTAA